MRKSWSSLLILLSCSLFASPAHATSCDARALLEHKGVRTIRILVDQISRRPGRWSCDIGSCIPLTLKWSEALTEWGIPGVAPTLVSQTPRGVKGAPSSVYHAFIVIPASVPGDEIIVDPTYRQYLYYAEGLPQIFVGTRQELVEIFTQYTSVDMDAVTELDPGTDLDPERYVEAVYGFGFSPKSARRGLRASDY